jgi:hypothetical protein
MLKTYKANHVFIEGKRYQKWGDNHYPGVTTILSATKPQRDKQKLDEWKAKVGAEQAEFISKSACDRGSEVHKCIEDTLVGKTPICSEQHLSFWESIRPVLKNVSNIQLIEGALWHPEGFAGSVDCVADWNGQLSVIDWKTSTKPKKEQWILDYKLQTAAYCAAVNRLYNLKINRGVIVIANGNKPADVFEIDDLFGYWQQFKKRVKLFHEKHQKTILLTPPCSHCSSSEGKINIFTKKQFNKPNLVLKSLDCAKCGKYQKFIK